MFLNNNISGFIKRAEKILIHNQWILLGLLIFVATLIYTFINIQKHQSFQTFGWDTSVFDQQIYLASVGKFPFSSLNEVHGLADHFHPILLFVGALLYKIYPHPNVLFALQSLVFSLSTLPLYLINKFLLDKLKLAEGIKILINLSLCIMYLFSVASQAAVLDEIHDDVFVALPVLFMVYFMIKKNWLWFWISYMLLLLTKEEYGLLGLPLAIYVYWQERNFKIALTLFFIGISFFMFLIFYIMPSLGGLAEYKHLRKENHPVFIIKKYLTQPFNLITDLFDHSEKQKTWITSLISFNFLPLFAPFELILPISTLGIRFYDSTTARRYEFNNHYASPFIPLWAFSASFGLMHLLKISIHKFPKIRNYIGISVICSISFFTLFQDILFHGPVNSLLKPGFYKTYSWQRDAFELIDQVPKEVTVSAQNSLLPHLSQREIFYLFPEVKDAKYIVLDLQDGPNKFSALTARQTKEIMQRYIEQGIFSIIWQKNQAILLKGN